MGGSTSINQSYSSFYEYDAAFDTWTAKASYPSAVSDAMAFTINNEVYVCGGINFATLTGLAALRKYDASTNTWVNGPAMLGGATMGAVAVTVGNKAFVGTGYTSALTERADWWEFSASACAAPMAYTTTVTGPASAGQCSGKIVVSNIANGCAPYTCTVVTGTGTVPTVSGSGASFSITSLCPGSYSVYITDANCCGTKMSAHTVPPTNVASGIAGVSEAEEIAVFPNPNNGTFIITGDLTDSNIRVTNMLGQEVPLTLTKTDSGTEIIMAEAQSGIYFLQLMQNGKVLNRKIQVN
jgi:hypothetical protein